MSLAFEEVFGIADAIQGVSMASRTDAWILKRCCAHGIPPDSPTSSDSARSTSVI